jgi:hypothetical protein
MERARQSGYADGSQEARLMLIALGKQFERSKAIGWLNTAVEKGRADKLAQRAIGREIDAWEMSCRIMFVVTINGSQRSSRWQRIGAFLLQTGHTVERPRESDGSWH